MTRPQISDVANRYARVVQRLDRAAPSLREPRRKLQRQVWRLGDRIVPDATARVRTKLEPASPEPFPHTLVRPDRMPSFDELAEVYPDEEVPPLDRATVDESALTWDQLHWRRNGFLILNGFLPDDLIDGYTALRDRLDIGLGGLEPVVWEETSDEIKSLGCYAPLAEKIRELLGEDLALNFVLTQYTSTERGWHQDDYLGPDEVYGRYCAVWMALDDIHPDSGPFQFIPGSHRWAGMRGRLVRDLLEPEVQGWIGLPGQGGHWAKIADPFVAPAYQDKIEAENLPMYTFNARRGDALIWHGKLVHRGSIANIKGMPRPTLICHYYPLDIGSGADGSRVAARYKNGGYYWPNQDAALQDPAPEAMTSADPSDVFAPLTDEEWHDVVVRSIVEPVIDGVRMPGFPDPAIQALYTSTQWEETLAEAFSFFRIAKGAAAAVGRPLHRDAKLLDFGVGWGRIARMFMKDIAGDNIYGVDVDPQILDLCRELMPSGHYSLTGNDEPLPFEDATFDVATAFSVFSHLSPKTHVVALNELHRVLRPNGLLVLTTLSRGFIDECYAATSNPESSDWARERAQLVSTTFPDWRTRLLAHEPSEFFYLPAGGGFEWTGPEHYGWSMITVEYAKEHWTDRFDIVDHIDDPSVFKQACFVLQKRS
jgi:ubiquinone/menaquinone biosynthesis C-methylase UbiE